MSKKVYHEPTIIFEDFMLCSNIAAGCEWKTNLPSADGGACPYFDKDSGKYMFVDNNSCAGYFQPVDGAGSICYHVPTDTSNVFNS